MNKTVRFLNLEVSETERVVFHSLLENLMRSGHIILGPEVLAFEKAIAEKCGRKYAVGVGSGSDALYLALSVLDIGPGDQVITTSLSWIATANAIAITGAEPVFADIGDDLNIDVNSVKSLISHKTKAVVAVDFTGRLANARLLTDLCTSNGIYLIEDGSQAFGAISDGYRCGGYGIVSAISHNPMKVLSALGEAGSVLTDNLLIKERLESLRYNGTINKEWLYKPSINARLDTFQAAILLERLNNIDVVISKRQDNAYIYNSRLNLSGIVTPSPDIESFHVYYTYTILADFRDELLSALSTAGIECKIQHPLLMSEQEPYRSCISHSMRAELLKSKLLCLPVHEKLTESDIHYVCDHILAFYKAKAYHG